MHEKAPSLPKKTFPNPNKARDYFIDSMDLAGYIIDAEMEFDHANKDTDPHAAANVCGFTDYLIAAFKNGLPYNLSFDDISFDFKGMGRKFDSQKVGALIIRDTVTGFDFISSSGGIITPRKTPAIEIHVPTIKFPPESKAIVTSGMISRSFGMLADYVYLHDLKPEIIFGLTYPRMGKLTKRWGFTVEECPFPKEMYEVIDNALGDCKDEPDAVRDLNILRSQTLIYHTRDSFVEMAKPHQRLPRK